MHRGAIVEPQWKAQARSVHWESDHAVCARIEGALDCLCVIRGVVAPRAPVNHGAKVFQEQHHLSEALCKNAAPACVEHNWGLNLPCLETAAGWCPAQCAVALPRPVAIRLGRTALRDGNPTEFANAPKLAERRHTLHRGLCAFAKLCTIAGESVQRARVRPKWRPGNDANDYNSRIPTYYSALQEAGYWTMTAGQRRPHQAFWAGLQTWAGCLERVVSHDGVGLLRRDPLHRKD